MMMLLVPVRKKSFDWWLNMLLFSGLGMLVCQGALNFTIWTGKEAPYDVMYEALKKEFA